jgi:hypothetical protein
MAYVIDFIDYGLSWLLVIHLEEGESIDSVVQKLQEKGLNLPEPLEIEEWVDKRLLRYLKEFGFTNYLEGVLLDFSFTSTFKKD